MWAVDVEHVSDWLAHLDDDTRDQVYAAIEILEDKGPQLGRPLVDTLTSSRHSNMKELRPGSAKRSEIRILFAFDPMREAILLLAGDKARNWDKWYKINVPLADDLFDQHLELLKERKQ